MVVDNTSPDEAATALFRITRLNLSRDTLFSRMFSYRPRPYDKETLDSLGWFAARVPGGLIEIINGVPVTPATPPDSMVAFAAIRTAMQFPAYQAPFEQVRRGRNGDFWLARSNAMGGDVDWVIFTADGKPRGRLTVPQNVWISLLDGDTVWGVLTDDVGVPWVVKYSLRTAQPGSR